MPNRPIYLNLLRIRLPLPGLISIMHRVSGAALFLALPILLWWWQRSLASAASFDALQATFSNASFKLVAIGLIWGYLHHLCAGVRHLLLDLDIGSELRTTRAMSWGVLTTSLVLTVVLGVCLW